MVERQVLVGDLSLDQVLSSLILGNTTGDSAIWIFKNRLRLRYAQYLRDLYGKKFLLIGNEWSKYGLESITADYSQEFRNKIYAESRICLDLLSKSSFEVHYTRSAEIISHSNGILQLRTNDSFDFFGSQESMCCFSCFNELKLKIQSYVEINVNEFDQVGDELRS